MSSMQQIEICDWSAGWSNKFSLKAAAIHQTLGYHAVGIDHIGSTSIEGLAARPIIDIQISVADLQIVEILTERLATIGYVWRPSNADLTKRYFRERPGDERTHMPLTAVITPWLRSNKALCQRVPPILPHVRFSVPSDAE